MIERFFDELRRSFGSTNNATEPPQPNNELHSQAQKHDDIFLAALPTIRKIIWRRLFSAGRQNAPDLIQKIIVQLLTWRENNPEKSEEMSAQEWHAFASKTAYRAINRHSSSRENLIDQLDETAEIEGGDLIAGNTEAETASLLNMFWQGICTLSLRQRTALLLGSESLLVLLKVHGIGNREIAEVLEISESEFLEIIARLPLKDAQIAHLTAARESAKNRKIESLTKSIKKARHEARARLQKFIIK